jgi:hypothetical protein
MSKIKRITVIDRVGGRRVATDILSPKGKRKKRPKWARGAAKRERKMLELQETYWAELRRRHLADDKRGRWRSWRNAAKNQAKALRKALKKVL